MSCSVNPCSTTTGFPSEIKYFREELISEVLAISKAKPEIEQVLDVEVWPEILSTKLIETQIGMSNEGQYLSGYKYLVELKLTEKVKYVACEPTQTIHAAYFETLRSSYVIIPRTIDGKNICDAIRGNRIRVTPFIEAVRFRVLDPKTVYKYLLVLLNVTIC